MQGVPPDMDSVSFTMTIVANDDGTFSGSSAVMGQSSQFDEITFNESTGEFFAKSSQQGVTSIMRGTLEGETISGTWEVPEMGGSGNWEATKESSEVDEEEAEKDETTKEPIEIDIEGFEDRAFQLPIAPGMFGTTGINNRNQLLYVRRSGGGDQTGVMLFDIEDDSKAEKSVVRGAFTFEVSADGKKLVVRRGPGVAIANASAGGSAKNVVTNGMTTTIQPREEWEQLFHDTWRIYRDFFYVPNMHGVDWKAVRKQYEPMLKDCATREDLNYVIGEMIAELNVGHAYRFGGDTENEPRRPVGMLGVDFELENGAYRITKIYEGGPWDIDAQGPLSMPGVDINEGDYLLAVNGVPIDPWAAFIGLAGQTITLTVNEQPEVNDEAREVVVETIRGDSELRYRHWIEQKRKYVDEQTDGKVGYIYVPNTGINGQNDLFRQFFGQMHKEALIIDERWNGGGQIPTRFIELLNRPVTNYWARRDGKNWRWPPDSHQGPKCMLINGLAGSGGDMFPALFKQAGLGPLIGTRTWGGLVGISGNPQLIDGGGIFVPTFGYYEKDGTWGIEGHGVDPDIEVIDDPAKMVDGGDPQLDKAIEVMLEKIKTGGYEPPKQPEPPDRSGMGILEEDK
jgi:tricorn protease